MEFGGSTGVLENESDAELLDDEVDELMNSVALCLEITLQKGQKTWNELRDGIDKILKAEKSKITLTLSQVCQDRYSACKLS